MSGRLLLLIAAVASRTVSPAATIGAQMVRQPIPRATPIPQATAKPMVVTLAGHLLPLPPLALTVLPPGISVQMQTMKQLAQNVGGPGQPAFSLGMATNFNVQTSCLPGTGTNCSMGQGSIQFTPGNDLAMWLTECAVINCPISTLTISNASPQGTIIYMLKNVSVTGSTSSAAISVTLQYPQVEWTFTTGNGQPPTYGRACFGVDGRC